MDEQSPQKSPVGKPVQPGKGDHPPDKDLSSEIERTVDRDPLDLVKCVRVFGNYYRCNWWSRAGGERTKLDFAWSGINVDFVRKSSFMSATMRAEGLIIQEISSGGPKES